jgi:ChrR Cupin-like domain
MHDLRQALAIRPERPNAGTPRHVPCRFRPGADLPGVEFALLYEDASGLVLLERWAPGTNIAVLLPGGIELLVLDGSFTEGGEEFTQLSWLRLPAGAKLQATAGAAGCKVWVKSGHLARDPQRPTAP